MNQNFGKISLQKAIRMNIDQVIHIDKFSLSLIFLAAIIPVDIDAVADFIFKLGNL